MWFVSQYPSHCRVLLWAVSWLALAHSRSLLLSLTHSCSISGSICHSHSCSFRPTLAHSGHFDSLWLSPAHSGSLRRSSASRSLLGSLRRTCVAPAYPTLLKAPSPKKYLLLTWYLTILVDHLNFWAWKIIVVKSAKNSTDRKFTRRNSTTAILENLPQNSLKYH